MAVIYRISGDNRHQSKHLSLPPYGVHSTETEIASMVNVNGSVLMRFVPLPGRHQRTSLLVPCNLIITEGRSPLPLGKMKRPITISVKKHQLPPL